ncbi:MAG: HypC/HybG/HupF family hydrogenase formation chaperone [Acidimicrobiales bacterium]
MCLGIPGRIIETHDDRGTPMATVDFGGARKTVCLAFAPDSEIGDWVIVHAGFAIATLDEAAAQESLELFAELGMVEPADGALPEADGGAA